jgi:hypothetical protein
MADEFQHPELNRLSPEVKSRVQDALKATLDKELAAGAVARGVGAVGSPVAAHSRSQGAFFSRSKTTDQLRPGDELVVNQVAQLDDAAFEKFANRLATLKNMNKPTT